MSNYPLSLCRPNVDLDDGSSSSSSSIPPITLSQPVRNEVSNTSKQYLKLHGRRVLVSVPEFYRDNGLHFTINGNITSVLFPLDDHTRKTLGVIEGFVKANVQSERYKPLWLGDNMYCNVSQWCQYECINSDGTRSAIQPGTVLGKGYYSMMIHASHVYIGPHRGGETFSVSLHVVNITYKEGSEVMDLIESLSNGFNGDATSSAPQLTTIPKPKPKKKAGRPKKAGRDEIDGPRTAPPPPFINGHVL